MSGLSANKKILISVVAFLLVIAAVVGVLLVVGGKEPKTPENTEIVTVGDNNYDVSAAPPVDDPTEPVSHTVPTTSPAMNTSNTADQTRIIEAYISGNYYISAVMYPDGDRPMDVDMAIRGKDFQTSMVVDNMRLTVMYMNGSIYFVDEDSKKYLDISRTFLTMFGVDLSELEDLTAELSLNNYDFKGVDLTQVELNGSSADCYRYYTNNESVYFYFVGSELRQIDYGDANGNIGLSIVVNQFSPTIPGNMFNLTGLTKTTMTDFFGLSLN